MVMLKSLIGVVSSKQSRLRDGDRKESAHLCEGSFLDIEPAEARESESSQSNFVG